MPLISKIMRFTCVSVVLFWTQVNGQVSRSTRRPLVQRPYTVASDGTGRYRTIQEAVDKSELNSIIRVKAGIYRENLILRNFISLEGDPAGRTLVIGSPTAPVIQAYNISSLRLRDLSFEFDQPTAFPVLLVRYSNFSADRVAFRRGATGVEMKSNSTVTLRECSISDNTGYGISVSDRSQGTITQSFIYQNEASGISVSDKSSPLIERNIIRDNKKDGLLINLGSVGKVIGNTIYRNGENGITIDGQSNPLIRNNTIVFHKNDTSRYAEKETGYGVLIRNASGLALINNNIVWNHIGIGQKQGTLALLSNNNVWNNGVLYEGIEAHHTDVSHDPMFLNAAISDFRIDTTSKIYMAGEDRLSIGSHYDYVRSDKKTRLDYLKTQAAKDLAKENWYQAFQNAKEILEIDKTDTEGKSLHKRAASQLADMYTKNARTEYEKDSYRIARGFLDMALGFDPEFADALELKQEIEEESRWINIRFTFVAVSGCLVLAVLIFYMRKRSRRQELRRQAQWWVDDADENIVLARTAEAEMIASEDFKSALDKFSALQKAFAEMQYGLCESLSAEVVRLAIRAKDSAERYKQLRKEALLEVSNAELDLKNFSESEDGVSFPKEISEYRFYLERAQDALVQKHYVMAKEIADDIQRNTRDLRQRLQTQRETAVITLIQETETCIIEALAGHSSADIIMAVMDFRSELQVLKSGFENGQLSVAEVTPQVEQIKSFVEEAMRLGGVYPSSASKAHRSYYDILGIKEDASIDQIKAVYRKLSMIYHPDANAADDTGIVGDERFKEIKAAYEALLKDKQTL